MTFNDATSLIPDFYHGLLDPEAREQFENELAHNRVLQQELNEFQKISSFFQEESGDDSPPSAALFAKICVSIDDSASEEQTHSFGRSRFQELKKYLSQGLRSVRESVAIPWAMALVQTAVIIILLLPATEKETFRTLGFTAAPENAAVISLNVVFKESARASEIRTLLLRVQGSVISGPSQEGRYIITIPAGNASSRSIALLQKSQIVNFIKRAY